MHKVKVIAILTILLLAIFPWESKVLSETIQNPSIDQLIYNLMEKDILKYEETAKEIFRRGDEAIPSLISALQDLINKINTIKDKKSYSRKVGLLVRQLILSGGSGEAFKLLKPYFFSTVPEHSLIRGIATNLCIGIAGLKDQDCELMNLKAFEGATATSEDIIYTLGLSKNKKYLPFLEKKWQGLPEVRRAIYWIKVGPLPQRQGLTDMQRIRQLIFEFMIIGDSMKESFAIKFTGQEGQEFYGYEGKLFYLPLTEGISPDVRAIVTFDEVIFSPSNSRAYTSVEFHEGPRAGKGYKFLLEKIQDEWQITTVWLSWIA